MSPVLLDASCFQEKPEVSDFSVKSSNVLMLASKVIYTIRSQDIDNPYVESTSRILGCWFCFLILVLITQSCLFVKIYGAGCLYMHFFVCNTFMKKFVNVLAF